MSGARDVESSGICPVPPGEICLDVTPGEPKGGVGLSGNVRPRRGFGAPPRPSNEVARDPLSLRLRLEVSWKVLCDTNPDLCGRSDVFRGLLALEPDDLGDLLEEPKGTFFETVRAMAESLCD